MKSPEMQNDARSAIQLAVLASAAVTTVALAMAATAGPAANHPMAGAQQVAGPSSSNAVIRKMVAHYSSLRSLRVNIAGSMPVTVNGKKFKISIRETLALQRPDKFAYTALIAPTPGDSSDVTNVELMSDGHNTVTYSKSIKQYISSPATRLAAIAARNASQANAEWMPAPVLLLSLFTDSPAGTSTNKLIGAARVDGRTVLNGTPVEILKFSSTGSGYFSAPKGSRFYVAVDPRTGRLVRATTILAGGSGLVITESVQPIEKNAPLSATFFTFRPPADVKLVDRFQAPSGSASAAPSSSGPENSATKTTAQMVGKPAPDFSLQDVNGKTIDLNSLKGRTILMDFSASW